MQTDFQSAHPLQVTGLEIGYKTKKEVHSLATDLNFTLPPGSLNAVVGVNGVGKSTLLRTLSGMHPTLQGKVHLQGIPLDDMEPLRRAQCLSVVLTEPLASKNLTVTELVRLGRHPYTNWIGQLSPADRTRVAFALDRMELQPIADQPCHTLSDGQLQRTLIGRALAQDTPLMLLDEPTTHLDLYHKVNILKLLKQVAHTAGKTILFSTHEIDLAIQLCDQILILDADFSQFGSPCQLIESGAFEKLFPTDTIRFDRTTGMFKVNK
ncbi:ABC transporter ATP-binding protein [Robiginitalea aurantiaca]|uniref:ABC transporter ATP-binding protein n=1 Tax=Robiginitalea aurantiaca TaxID=3056915 RepID=A0ABT7WCL4_9FLAO|nr:ABC transporter ATP-binding protein [Robiginitalea aurantiaca]MDM9630564.1 ABC transporter ATP-binding protein [Robiginitalea aurantiaca]